MHAAEASQNIDLKRKQMEQHIDRKEGKAGVGRRTERSISPAEEVQSTLLREMKQSVKMKVWRDFKVKVGEFSSNNIYFENSK